MSMKEFSLNIYGENDEIVKTVETDIIRWGVFMKAVKLQDEIKGKDDAEQMRAVSEFMTVIFPDLSVDDLENADTFDIFNTFAQIVNKATNIKGLKDITQKTRKRDARKRPAIAGLYIVGNDVQCFAIWFNASF